MKKLILAIVVFVLIGVVLLGCESAAPPPPLPTPTLVAGQYTHDDLIHVFDYDPQEPLF